MCLGYIWLWVVRVICGRVSCNAPLLFYFSELSKPLSEIAFGFLNGFSNAVGRSATKELLDLLFQSEEIIVRNLGGSSPSPHSRDITFVFEVEACPSSSSESSQRKVTTTYQPQVNVAP